jgi:hypothetical protein
VGTYDGGQLLDRIDASRNGDPTRSHGERRQLVDTQPQHRNAQGLEVLERAGQVEERLCPRADRDHAMASNRPEVGADVAGQVGVAMHPSDASRGEHRDPHRIGQKERG